LNVESVDEHGGLRTAYQLYEFGGDGNVVLGDYCVRAETAATRDTEIQSRLH